jgi:hypothetical protein
MKKISYFFLIIIAFIACDKSPKYPTYGIIELTEGKLDSLSNNIKIIVKDSIKAGAAGIYAYEQDSIYNLEWTNWADSMPKGTVKRVRFNYRAKNIASRTVRRKSEAYLDANLMVLGYKDLVFVDAMSKDSIKNSLRTEE